MRLIRFSARTFVFLLSVAFTRAASLYTEGFSASSGGWQGRSTNTVMVMTNALSGGQPDGCLQGTFGSISFPSAASDAFLATGALASANFIGDYDVPGLCLLGFDFQARDVLPDGNALRVNIRSGSLFITRKFDALIVATGEWYGVRMPLVANQLSGWQNDVGLFSSIMTNVTRLEVEVRRTGEGQQVYLLDNIFLDRLHGATGLAATNSGEAVLSWSNLRTGEVYRLEAADQISSNGWSLLESFTATSATYQAQISATNPAACYRLILQ